LIQVKASRLTSVNAAGAFHKACAAMDSGFLLNVAIFLVVILAFAVALRLLVPIIMQHFPRSAGGWSRLSESYATTQPRPTQVFDRQSVVVGQVLYRNSMVVGFDDRGLYLELGFPLSALGRRALLVPWTEVRRIEDGRLFWRKAPVLSLGEPPVGTITMPEPLFKAIEPALMKGAKTLADARGDQP
jgi:hypothetical protein